MPAQCCIDRWNRLMNESPNMPVFTLLAQDKLAAEVVEFWMLRARAEGVNPDKLAKVQEHLEAIRLFREHNPASVRLPD